MTNIRKIKAPNILIKNENFHSYDFALYIVLRILAFNNHFNTYSKKIIEYLDWSSSTLLKKHLAVLYDNELIDTKYDSIPKFGKLDLEIYDTNNNFTFVDINSINIIIDVSSKTEAVIKGKKSKLDLREMGLRLFYYYEMLYNNKLGYAYPSYNDITNATGISTKYIPILNKVFEENNLLEIEHGKFYEYTDNSKKKERNKYIPNCIRSPNKKVKI